MATMKTLPKILVSVALVLGASALPASAQTADPPCVTVKATLSEYTIKLSKKKVKAECVQFKVINRGVEDHELIVVAGKKSRRLPATKGVVDETELAVLGETGDLATRARADLNVTLPKGKYVVFCNVLHESDSSDGHEGHGETKSDSHFGEGMHVIFTVKGA
jgi:hypothetical protein